MWVDGKSWKPWPLSAAQDCRLKPERRWAWKHLPAGSCPLMLGLGVGIQMRRGALHNGWLWGLFRLEWGERWGSNFVSRGNWIGIPNRDRAIAAIPLTFDSPVHEVFLLSGNLEAVTRSPWRLSGELWSWYMRLYYFSFLDWVYLNIHSYHNLPCEPYKGKAVHLLKGWFLIF